MTFNLIMVWLCFGFGHYEREGLSNNISFGYGSIIFWVQFLFLTRCQFFDVNLDQREGSPYDIQFGYGSGMFWFWSQSARRITK